MKSFIKDLINFKKKIKISPALFKGIIEKESLIKLLFNLLISIHLRVGNEKYAVTNKTYGLTTLLQKHLINNKLVFVGKSGISHVLNIPDEYVGIIKQFITKNKMTHYFIIFQITK